MKKSLLVSISVFIAFSTRAFSLDIVAPDIRKDLQITIYNGDLALINETRPITLRAGMNQLDFRGIAAQIRPETLLLPSLDVKELRFLNNMPSLERLYGHFLGKDVIYIEKDPASGQEKEQKATIIALAGSQPLLRIGDRIEVNAPGRIVLPEWPDLLQAEPSLLLTIEAKNAGAHDAKMMYLTRGLHWAADYVAILSGDEKSITLTGYASIQNNSGTSFKKAALRLVSGQVNTGQRLYLQRQGMEAAASSGSELAKEEGLSDYHLYTLPGLIDLQDGELKQLSLIKTAEVPVEKEYLFSDLAGFLRGTDGLDSNPMPNHAAISIKFVNRTESNLGQPMPSGTARIYSQAQNGSAFLGESAIGDIPIGEEAALMPGKAFDVTARIHQTSFERKSDQEREIGIEMVINNARAQDAPVVVTENIFGDWSISQESEKHYNPQVNQVGWRLVVPANGSKKFSYKILIRNP